MDQTNAVETLKNHLEDLSRGQLLEKAQKKLSEMYASFEALKTADLRKKLLAVLKG